MNKTEIKENLVYLGIWVLLFLSVIISVYVRVNNDSALTFRWDEVFMTWRSFIPFLAVFLIHNYVIAPVLIYKKKSWLYISFTLIIVIIFQMYKCGQKPEFEPDGPKDRMEMRGFGPMDRPPLPKDNLSKSGQQNHPDGERPDFPHPELDKRGPEGGPMDKHDEPPFLFGNKELFELIAMLLMLGMNLGVKLYFKTSKDAIVMQELEKRNLEQQLEYLKYQINPHFFMNTLNNIHALVDIDPEEAKGTIIELSKMMRYVLYEGAKSMVPLSKDIEFLNHYITLMKLRYTDKVKINVDIPTDLPNKMIPPMMFITFVENAFKHGVSYRKESFIDVSLSLKEERLIFTCRNSKPELEHQEHGGVGLKNTRQRLDLIYGSDYQLDIQDNAETYEVRLEFPVNGEDASQNNDISISDK